MSPIKQSTLIRQLMPVRDPMIDPNSGLVSRPWQKFFRTTNDVNNASPVRVGGGLHLDDQHTSLVAVALPLGELPPGYYRVGVYARRTTIAATSSSLDVTIGWREGGQTLSATQGNAINSLTAPILGSLLIKIDQNSQIAYATVYASVAANEMRYSLDIVVEQVQVG